MKTIYEDFAKIQVGELLVIAEILSFPKLKVANDMFFDTRNQSLHEFIGEGKCRLMTQKEIGIACYGATKKEAEKASWRRYNNWLKKY